MIDVLLWVVMCVPLFLATEPLPEASRLSEAGLQVVAMAVFAVALVASHRVPVVGALLVLALSIALSGEFVYEERIALAQIVMAFMLGRRTSGRAAPVQVLALVAVTLAVQPVVAAHPDWLTAVSSLTLQVVLPWAVGQFLRQQADLVEAGFELARRLELEQVRAVARERLQEQARIAGDMHDSLGHDLALLAVKAGAIQVAADASPEHREAARGLRESAAAATARLRDIVGVLREADAPTAPHNESVRALVERAVDHGLTVTLHDVGADVGADGAGDAERAVRRVVQEALTNAAKHAPGARVDAAIGRTPEVITVRIANDLAASGGGASAEGYGLVGLDERVRYVGGSIDARREGDQFVVDAIIPTRPTQAAAPSASVPDGRSRQRNSDSGAVSS